MQSGSKHLTNFRAHWLSRSSWSLSSNSKTWSVWRSPCRWSATSWAQATQSSNSNDARPSLTHSDANEACLGCVVRSVAPWACPGCGASIEGTARQAHHAASSLGTRKTCLRCETPTRCRPSTKVSKMQTRVWMNVKTQKMMHNRLTSRAVISAIGYALT